MNQTMQRQTSPDRSIYLHEEWEVGYWTDHWASAKSS